MISINRYSKSPIYEQVITQLEKVILNKEINTDEPLPSIRTLSQELSINPNTLQKAYAELERKGITYSVIGNGRFVSPNAISILTTQKEALFNEINTLIDELLLSGWSLKDIINRIKNNFEGGFPND